MLTGEAALKPTIGQVGHMNFIHPFRVQMIGAAEASYLRSLPEDALQQAISRLFTTDLAAIIVANGEEIPKYLLDACNRHHMALLTSPQPSPHVVDVIRLYLSRMLAESTSLHGVFLDVLEMGVLITGASAIGKSELALELISRGNGLVADDIVELYRISPDTLGDVARRALDLLSVHRRAQHSHDFRRPRCARKPQADGPRGSQQRAILRARPAGGRRPIRKSWACRSAR